jgi:hypothetical protein
MNQPNIPPPYSLPQGHYIMMIGLANEDQKHEAELTMRRNGCKSVRFDTLPDGQIQVHGFLYVQ